MNTYISAIDYYLPSQVVKTRDMMAETKPERLGFSDTLIEDLIGIYEVRHAQESEKPSTLASNAAEKAIAKFEGNADEIDLLIFCGIDRDYVEPSTAHVVQKNLGLKNAVCFDISNACLGFMTGIQVANSAIGSGIARNVLICTGERPSQVTKVTTSHLSGLQNKTEFYNKIGALTVGDAGAAAIISQSQGLSGIRSINFNSNGKLSDLCYYKHENGVITEGQMMMKEISSAMLKAHKKMLPQSLQLLKKEASDVKCLITHQVGKTPWKGFSRFLGINADRMTKTFDTLGNITSATFGVNYAITVESGNLKKGDLILAAMAGSGLSTCQIGIIH